MAYEAELELRVNFTREPDDDEAEAVAERLADALKGVTVQRTTDTRKRIGVVDAEVTNWRGV